MPAEQYLQGFDKDYYPLYIGLASGQVFWTLPEGVKFTQVLYLTHVTEDGKRYYEQLNPTAVVWTLPEDTRIISYVAMQMISRVEMMNQDELSESIIKQPFNEAASARQMELLDDYLLNYVDNNNQVSNSNKNQNTNTNETTMSRRRRSTLHIQQFTNSSMSTGSIYSRRSTGVSVASMSQSNNENFPSFGSLYGQRASTASSFAQGRSAAYSSVMNDANTANTQDLDDGDEDHCKGNENNALKQAARRREQRASQQSQGQSQSNSTSRPSSFRSISRSDSNNLNGNNHHSSGKKLSWQEAESPSQQRPEQSGGNTSSRLASTRMSDLTFASSYLPPPSEAYDDDEDDDEEEEESVDVRLSASRSRERHRQSDRQSEGQSVDEQRSSLLSRYSSVQQSSIAQPPVSVLPATTTTLIAPATTINNNNRPQYSALTLWQSSRSQHLPLVQLLFNHYSVHDPATQETYIDLVGLQSLSYDFGRYITLHDMTLELQSYHQRCLSYTSASSSSPYSKDHHKHHWQRLDYDEFQVYWRDSVYYKEIHELMSTKNSALYVSRRLYVAQCFRQLDILEKGALREEICVGQLLPMLIEKGYLSAAMNKTEVWKKLCSYSNHGNVSSKGGSSSMIEMSVCIQWLENEVPLPAGSEGGGGKESGGSGDERDPYNRQKKNQNKGRCKRHCYYDM